MPKQKGVIKIKGTLNGICYYSLKGEHLLRKAAGPSMERIQTDPAFANLKSNMQEFGAASKLSKAIRTGFFEIAMQFKDSHMASRLSGLCRKIIQKGNGSPGQRDASLANDPKAFIGFQLNKNTMFHQVYKANPIVTSSENRDVITISILESNTAHLNKRPKKATHFQLTSALSLVSKYKCYSNKKAYYPVALKQNALGISQKTGPLACNIEHKNLQIQLKTPVTSKLSSNIDITVWLGIQYLKQEGSQFHALETYKAMQCIALL